MDVKSHIYGPETLISAHTNRPVTTKEKTYPVYWCKICCMKLASPSTALQHVYGRPHKNKAKKDSVNQNNQHNALNQKRQLKPSNVTQDQHVVQEPAAKKSKDQKVKSVQPDPNLRCDDCNLVFDSLINSIQHFKYNRHGSSSQHDKVGETNQNHFLQQNNAVESIIVNPVKPVVEEPAVKMMVDKPVNPVEPAVKMMVDKPVKPVEPAVNLKCYDCKLSFANTTGATEHYQGKRHAKTIAAKVAAKQNETMSMWQKGFNKDVRGVGRGRARGGGFTRRGGSQYKNIQPRPKVTSSNFPSVVKEFAVSGVGLRSNYPANATKGIGNDSQTHNNYNSNPNVIKPVMNDLTVNPSSNMQHESRNAFSSIQNNSFHGNSTPSNYVAPRHQTSNYGTPQYQTNDYGTLQYQISNQPKKPEEYFPPSNVGSQKDTFSDEPPQDMYNNSIQVKPNDYNRSTPSIASKDNFSGDNNKHYSSVYHSDTFSFFNENY